MSNDLWGEEEPFSDMPEEAQTSHDGKPAQVSHQYAPPQLPRPSAAPQPGPKPDPEVSASEEQFEEEVEAEEDFSEVLTDANLRLEQGMLYKAILNHNLFEGMESDPKAIANVQKEIRNFARERMEVMLGMRRESATVERLEIDFPFNALEVEVLKALAFKATKGDTEHSDRYVPSVSRVTEEIPVVGAKRQMLNPIGSPTKKSAPSRPLQKKAAAPVKRTKLDATIEQIAREEGVPVELLEVNVPGVGGKPIHELTASELEARNKLAAQRRGGQVRPPNALPMATPEQEALLAVQRATQVADSMSRSPLMSKLLETVKTMPITKT